MFMLSTTAGCSGRKVLADLVMLRLQLTIAYATGFSVIGVLRLLQVSEAAVESLSHSDDQQRPNRRTSHIMAATVPTHSTAAALLSVHSAVVDAPFVFSGQVSLRCSSGPQGFPSFRHLHHKAMNILC